MPGTTFEVALFAADPDGGVRMVGRSVEPAIVDHVRAFIAAERTRELADLTPPVRIMREAAGK